MTLQTCETQPKAVVGSSESQDDLAVEFPKAQVLAAASAIGVGIKRQLTPAGLAVALCEKKLWLQVPSSAPQLQAAV